MKQFLSTWWINNNPLPILEWTLKEEGVQISKIKNCHKQRKNSRPFWLKKEGVTGLLEKKMVQVLANKDLLILDRLSLREW